MLMLRGLNMERQHSQHRIIKCLETKFKQAQRNSPALSQSPLQDEETASKQSFLQPLSNYQAGSK